MLSRLLHKPILLLVLLIVIGPLSLVSCSGSSKQAKAPTVPVSSDAKNSGSPAKREVRDLFGLKSKVLEYSYNPIGKRDPFKQFTGNTQLTLLGGSGGPLTAYDVDQMRLVAVIWGISNPRAMLLLPDNKSYIVKRNSPIGRNYGKVARITPKSISIEEEFRGPLGDLQIKETKLLLHEDAGNAIEQIKQPSEGK